MQPVEPEWGVAVPVLLGEQQSEYLGNPFGTVCSVEHHVPFLQQVSSRHPQEKLGHVLTSQGSSVGSSPNQTQPSAIPELRSTSWRAAR